MQIYIYIYGKSSKGKKGSNIPLRISKKKKDLGFLVKYIWVTEIYLLT